MQRKNYILKQRKSGFAMIMAITVIVILGTIMALSLSLTSQTAKRTTDLYLYEQTVLYSKSAAELALLDIAQAVPCTHTLRNYPFDGGLYNATVRIQYVYRNPSPCVNVNDNYFQINTDEQDGSVLMDITVTTTAGTEDIRYFRRSIQKL